MRRQTWTAAAAGLLALGAMACQQEGGQAGKESAGNAASGTSVAARSDKSILDAVTQSAEHRGLADAVKAAGLTETLSGSGPYTLFAPNDAAFAKLPAETSTGLLAPEAKGRLTTLIASHIVTGLVTADDLAKAIERGKGKAVLATLGGSQLTASRSGDAIVIADGSGGQGRISGAEMMQSNGVVHVVDTMLMPK